MNVVSFEKVIDMITEKQKNLERYIEAVKNAFLLCTMESWRLFTDFFLLLCSYFYNGGVDGESGLNPRSGKEKTNSMTSPSPPSVNGKSEGDL